jgi:hypothetical protein
MFGTIQKKNGKFGTKQNKSRFGTVAKTSRASINNRPVYIYKANEMENPLLENIYTFLEASYAVEEGEAKMTKLGYRFDKDLSTIRTRVWVKNGKPLILHRGSTDVLSDFVVSDTLLFFNKSQFDPRYYEAKRITKQTQEKYGEIADHVGHSLGSAVAELVADKRSWVVTYNKGASPYSIFKPINERQTDIRNKYDLISLMSRFQDRNVITLEKSIGLFSPHTIDNLKDFDAKATYTPST